MGYSVRVQRRRSLTTLVVASLLAWGPTSRADDALYSHIYYEAGYQELFGGFGWNGDDGRGATIHIYERGGIVGQVVVGALLGAVFGLATPQTTSPRPLPRRAGTPSSRPR